MWYIFSGLLEWTGIITAAEFNMDEAYRGEREATFVEYLAL